MKAEDLSEEQLEAAITDLGIEGQEPSDRDAMSLEAEEDKNPSVGLNTSTEASQIKETK